MAMFDNVTFNYYSVTMGRNKIPDAATFDDLKLEIVLYVKSLINDGLLIEREPNGIDSACCMMIEETYLSNETEKGNDGAVTSESIGGYSYTKSGKAAELAVEKNSKSLAEKKYKWLSLYCEILSGVGKCSNRC